MKIIPMKCPQCSANINLDLEHPQVYCSFCGTKLILDDESQKIEIKDPENVGYQFEKGRQRAIDEKEKEFSSSSKGNAKDNIYYNFSDFFDSRSEESNNNDDSQSSIEEDNVSSNLDFDDNVSNEPDESFFSKLFSNGSKKPVIIGIIAVIVLAIVISAGPGILVLVGIGVLIWKKKKSNNTSKSSTFSSTIVQSESMTASERQIINEESRGILFPKGMEPFDRCTVSRMEATLTGSGFTNVTVVSLNDIKMGIIRTPQKRFLRDDSPRLEIFHSKNHFVDKVTINGARVKRGGGRYAQNARIVITYHGK